MRAILQEKMLLLDVHQEILEFWSDLFSISYAAQAVRDVLLDIAMDILITMEMNKKDSGTLVSRFFCFLISV